MTNHPRPDGQGEVRWRKGIENRLRDQNRECDELARRLIGARKRRRALVAKLVAGDYDDITQAAADQEVARLCDVADALDGTRAFSENTE